MDTARIAELLEPFLSAPIPTGAAPSSRTLRGWETTNPSLSPERCHSEQGPRPGEGPVIELANDILCQHISTYVDLLLRWNARINLTAIRDPEQIIARHFGESLFAARVLFPVTANLGLEGQASGCSVADLGSGAGFPGIPLKLWVPHLSLTLIESNHKKATFLREVTRALTLMNINVQNTRAESLLAHSFDLITLRAVERFENILPVASNLLTPTGRMALLIGAAQLKQTKSILPKLAWWSIPVPNSNSRILAIGHQT